MISMILLAGVEDLQHILIVDHEVEQRAHVQPGALGSIAAASLPSDDLQGRQSSGQ